MGVDPGVAHAAQHVVEAVDQTRHVLEAHAAAVLVKVEGDVGEPRLVQPPHLFQEGVADHLLLAGLLDQTDDALLAVRGQLALKVPPEGLARLLHPCSQDNQQVHFGEKKNERFHDGPRSSCGGGRYLNPGWLQ